MRLRHRSGRVVHLSHGANVRPARDLPAVVEHLDAYAAVRDRLCVETLGVSLWLPPTLAAALAIDGRSRTRLRAELDARGLEIRTLSGAPYSEGGDEDPDWSHPARLEYTLDLARILTDLLPEDAVRGAVTTTGLGNRAGWDEARQKSADRILSRLSGGLAEVAWHQGRAVRVGFQPGPGQLLDGVESIVAAFARLDRERLGVCLDLAGLACTWESPTEVLDRLATAGVSIIRVQVAAALEAADPVASAERLRGYAGYPVTNPEGGYAADPAEALDAGLPGPWRVRCPVPLHTQPAPPLRATTEVWRAALRHLTVSGSAGTEHLDVETSGRDDAAAQIAYALSALGELGLSPPAEAVAVH
ncbi:TIM barrel protein [Amorphoplanes digitatis]|uniref:Sugar phosphate isomerase/epimerase n=1 Tax=Actinoplanes digitatis TaxID=1868 RepID=A0A7W7I3K8_9ACTN|nr:TIM barrel protein [Actinoplanes digitatis]MBB4765834.1 sugar phosphate isomerase/epimerase [Actinoplanes digitatis]GID93374.1 xylose isomerase [Actinoplanes digitatis]